MFERFESYAEEHHQDLVRIAREARQARFSHAPNPTLKDHLYLRLGNFFVSLGENLRKESALIRPRKGQDEMRFPELSKECQ